MILLYVHTKCSSAVDMLLSEVMMLASLGFVELPTDQLFTTCTMCNWLHDYVGKETNENN